MSYTVNNSLSDEQRNFIPHVLEHIFPERAARAVGMDAHTAVKWMQHKGFRDELDRQRRLSAQNVMHALERYANKAVLVLVDMLAESQEDDALRIKAADTVLKHTIEYRKLYGLEGRVEELEAQAEQAKEVKTRHKQVNVVS